jgi:hypothetical protein
MNLPPILELAPSALTSNGCVHSPVTFRKTVALQKYSAPSNVTISALTGWGGKVMMTL